MEPTPISPLFSLHTEPLRTMALTIASAHVAIGPLLSGCYTIIQGINKLQQSYKFMHVTLTSIVLTCSITRVSLDRLDSILKKHPAPIAKFEKELFEGVKVASTAILSMLGDHVSELLDVAAGDILLSAQKTSKKKVLLALYNESDMKELLSKLQEQNALLDTILSFVQRYKAVKRVTRAQADLDTVTNKSSFRTIRTK